MSDSLIMLRRNLLHARRYPSMTISTIAMPVVFLLLFGFVFGEALGNGLGGTGGGGGGRSAYIAFMAPGLLVMTAAAGAVSTAVAIATDMTEGIIARFRTMAIYRGSILVGHVAGGVILNLVTLVLIVGVVLLAGFRPHAGAPQWIAALGLLLALTFALTWLSAALGLLSKTVEGASNIVLPLTFLPLLGSGFVPVDTMPPATRWFAENQPFTPIIDTLRDLLTGAPVGSSAWLAVGWCAAIALGGYAWARALFERER